MLAYSLSVVFFVALFKGDKPWVRKCLHQSQRHWHQAS